MAKLNLVIPKGDVPKWLKSILLTITNWANNISGICLEDNSVAYSKLLLNSRDIPTGKIKWPEWYIPLALPAEDLVTVSTDYARCSGIFLWDPSKYPTAGGKWYFDASISIADASSTVTAQLMGETEVTTVTHTGDISMVLQRSSQLTMPSTAKNLFVNFKTSNASHYANFAGARLVFVPD